MADRRGKIDRLRARGVDPFTISFPNRTDIAALPAPGSRGEMAVRIAGRLMGRRNHGQIAFMDVRDSSGEIEVLCLQYKLAYGGGVQVADIDVGDFFGVEGDLVTTKWREPAIEARSLTILGKALVIPPKRGTEPKYRRSDLQELDLIAGNASREMLRVRNSLSRFLRRWFDDQGFLEVDTPVLLPLASGSASRPFLTRGNALDGDLYLRIAIEQSLKRLTVGGFEKVYELGRCFRNEGISKRHHFEFTMLEWLQGYAHYHDTMDLIEAVVAEAAQEITGRLRFHRGGETFDLSRPWRRITAREAILEKTGYDIMSGDRDKLAKLAGVGERSKTDWAGLVSTIYSKLVEPNIVAPTFVIDFPRELFPLGRQRADTPELGESFEAVVAGVEISSGTTNLNDADEQRVRLAEQRARSNGSSDAEDEDGLAGMDEDFLRALARGMMPVTGAGLGVDRILMLLMERASLREVIPLPTL